MSQSIRLLDDILAMDLRRLSATYPTHNIRCGVLLVREDDGKILIVKEKPRGEFVGNIYGPPKGSAKWNDHEYFDVATRELIEETGIPIHNAQIAGPEIIIFHSYFREILFLFPVIIRSPPDPRPDYNEIEECQWMSFSELKERHNEESSYVRRLVSDLQTVIISGMPPEETISAHNQITKNTGQCSATRNRGSTKYFRNTVTDAPYFPRWTKMHGYGGSHGAIQSTGRRMDNFASIQYRHEQSISPTVFREASRNLQTRPEGTANRDNGDNFTRGSSSREPEKRVAQRIGNSACRTCAAGC